VIPPFGPEGGGLADVGVLGALVAFGAGPAVESSEPA
jgi:hypothetical protein